MLNDRGEESVCSVVRRRGSEESIRGDDILSVHGFSQDFPNGASIRDHLKPVLQTAQHFMYDEFVFFRFE